jgi:hypothetical protein
MVGIADVVGVEFADAAPLRRVESRPHEVHNQQMNPICRDQDRGANADGR